MAYKSAADGIVKKGKTKGKNIGNASQNKSDGNGKARTVTTEAMKTYGRNIARAKNQGGK